MLLDKLPELLLQGGGLLGLPAELRLHRGELLLGDQGIRRAALQLLAQGLDIGLGGGKLLQEIRLLLLKLRGLLLLRLQFLLEGLHLLVALAQQRLLLARRLTGPRQFAQQQLAAFVLLLQRQPHHRRQILPAVAVIGRDGRS